MTPDFNWPDCTGNGGSHISSSVCIGSGLGIAQNFLIWGSGLTSAANSNCANANGKVVFSTSPNGGIAHQIDLAGICPGQTNLTGIQFDVTDNLMDEGGAQEVGTIACRVSGFGVVTQANDCLNTDVTNGIGLQVDASGVLTDTSSYNLIGVVIVGKMNSRGTDFIAQPGVGAVSVSSGGQWVSNADNVGCASPNSTTSLVLNSGGQVQATNTCFAATGTAINTGGNFIDLGGNTVSSGNVLPTSTALWRGDQILSGTCSGTATASSTLGLFQLGQFSAATCTSTTVSLGKAMSMSGTLRGLTVHAGTGGVNASSGVVTVLKNGSATTLTCTLGTSTFCTDSTHSVAYSNRDVISIQFTTQTSETLANVDAEVLAW